MKSPNPFIHDPSVIFRNVDQLTDVERDYEIEALRDALTYHNYLLFILKEPELSDTVYLSLKNRLSELERYQLDRKNSCRS